MGDALREYVVIIGGLPHTLQLDDAEAKRLGVAEQAKAPEAKQAPAPKNKARSAATK